MPEPRKGGPDILYGLGNWLVHNIERLLFLFRLALRFVPWARTTTARVIQLFIFFGFWKKLANQGLVIILSPKDAKRILKGTLPCDIWGAEEIQGLLRRIGNQCEIVSAPNELNEAMLAQNLLVIGGPIYNQVARVLLKQKEIVYRFEEIELNNYKESEGIYKRDDVFKMQVEWDDNRTIVEKDLGIITIMKNPYNRKRKAILACGCRGWGTYSAVKLLGDKKNIKLLRQFGPYFQVLLTCGVGSIPIAQEPHLCRGTEVQLHYTDE